MKTKIFAALTLLAIAAPSAALAADCGQTDKAQWMTEDAAKAKGVELGYEVSNLKVEDGCYELYTTKDGQKAEVFMHPVTGDVVEVKPQS